uniref:EF-hand calcium binding domain 11 n=1 Tax=Amazona collaria TaxID=241587 RepID=A0A8B9G3W2_9PSIT
MFERNISLGQVQYLHNWSFSSVLITVAEVRKWEENRLCDKDNKGYLVREVLKGTAVMFFGYKHLKVYTFFHICFEDPAYVDVSLFAKKTSQLPSFFEFEDFKRAFSSISPKLPEKIIVEAFREIDQDSDGCISFKEFESAMNKT